MATNLTKFASTTLPAFVVGAMFLIEMVALYMLDRNQRTTFLNTLAMVRQDQKNTQLSNDLQHSLTKQLQLEKRQFEQDQARIQQAFEQAIKVKEYATEKEKHQSAAAMHMAIQHG